MTHMWEMCHIDAMAYDEGWVWNEVRPICDVELEEGEEDAYLISVVQRNLREDFYVEDNGTCVIELRARISDRPIWALRLLNEVEGE